MHIASVKDLADTLRGRRQELGMSQAELARRCGVSRKWVYDFEAGKPTAELGLALGVVNELGLRMEVAELADSPSVDPGSIDLDALLDDHRVR